MSSHSRVRCAQQCDLVEFVVVEKLLLRRCSTVESPVSVPGFCPRPWFLSLIYRPLGGGNEGISNQQQPLHRTAPGDPPKKKLVPKGILSTCFSHLGWVLNAIFVISQSMGMHGFVFITGTIGPEKGPEAPRTPNSVFPRHRNRSWP